MTYSAPKLSFSHANEFACDAGPGAGGMGCGLLAVHTACTALIVVSGETTSSIIRQMSSAQLTSDGGGGTKKPLAVAPKAQAGYQHGLRSNTFCKCVGSGSDLK